MIGVYTDDEGNINFYRMRKECNDLQKGDDECIRRVKGFDEFSFDKIKTMYSEDSEER